jgi:hypothetical protein
VFHTLFRMSTAQEDVTTKDSRSTRIREDVWEAARAEAFHSKTTLVEVIDSVLRAHFGLPRSDNSNAA